MDTNEIKKRYICIYPAWYETYEEAVKQILEIDMLKAQEEQIENETMDNESATINFFVSFLQ